MSGLFKDHGQLAKSSHVVDCPLNICVLDLLPTIWTCDGLSYQPIPMLSDILGASLSE